MSPGQPATDQTVQTRVRLEIAREISAATVHPAIAEINRISSQAPGTHVELHLRHNAGGSVDVLEELIECLEEAKCEIEITYSRYIMSSAAMLWLYFYVRGVEHVSAALPLKPGVVMYHRPRWSMGYLYHCFSDEITTENPIKAKLDRKIKKFDEVFDEVIEKFYEILRNAGSHTDDGVVNQEEGIQYRHFLSRLKESYYRNQDCLIPV